MSEQSVEAEVRELVQRHRVCFDLMNEYVYVDHDPEQIGFCVELVGTHRADVQHPEPGCGHCRDVYQALERIVIGGDVLTAVDGKEISSLSQKQKALLEARPGQH
jgi:hypothetical protein